MGSEASAIVCWGFNLGPERDLEFGIDDFMDKYAASCGVDRSGNYGKVLELWNASGCDIEVHGAGAYDDLSYIVMIGESKLSAYWDEAKELPALVVKPEWEAMLRDFCEKIGVEWKEPKWLLTSYYG